VTIYPSANEDGEFVPAKDSQIFLRVNDRSEETTVIRKTDGSCPSFRAGQKQTFDIDLKNNFNEHPQKLTFGYVNANAQATKWKLRKVCVAHFSDEPRMLHLKRLWLFADRFGQRRDG
jgi:hypothetical protein